MRVQRWLLAILIACGGLLAGVVGSALLIRQNELLDAQNVLIGEQTGLLAEQAEVLKAQTGILERQTGSLDQQVKLGLLAPLLQEANRRVPLYGDLSDVLGRIRAEAAGASSFVPSDDLRNDIQRLALQFTPYPHVDTRTMSGPALASLLQNPDSVDDNIIFLSPERGILLRALITAGADLTGDGWAEIDFTYSDMRGFRHDREDIWDLLDEAFAQFMDVPDSEIGCGLFTVAKTRIRRLTVRLDHSDFSEASMVGVRLNPYNVVMRGARLAHSELDVSQFEKLPGGTVSLGGSELISVWFGGNLDGLSWLDFRDTRWTCLTEASFRPLMLGDLPGKVFLDQMRVENLLLFDQLEGVNTGVLEGMRADGAPLALLPPALIGIAQQTGHSITYPTDEGGQMKTDPETFRYVIRK